MQRASSSLFLDDNIVIERPLMRAVIPDTARGIQYHTQIRYGPRVPVLEFGGEFRAFMDRTGMRHHIDRRNRACRSK